LAIESGLNDRTIRFWFNNGATPGLEALEKICDAFNMTLGEFFASNETTQHTNEFLSTFNLLTKKQRDIILTIMKSYLDDEDK